MEEYELLVVAKIHARGLSYSTSHVFYPKLIFLDDALAVVDTLEPQLGYRVGLFGSHYKGKVFLKPGYRYLVLYTDSTRLREKVFIRGSEFVTNSLNGVTVSGVKAAEYTNRGAAGTVEIGFERKVRAK